MKYTLEQLKEMMGEDGYLDLRGTGITSLPDNLTVGGYLDLEGCTGITALPDNLTVGGSLDLRGTGITALPDNLTVGGSLYLRGTGITALPDNLTVGGSLDLEGCTGITALPDNLTVGGYLALRGTGITEDTARRFQEGEYVPYRYLYADGILTHIKRKRKIGDYIFYQGKIKGKNVISDGTNYAHCKSFKDGVCDLEFKKAKDRGAAQYKGKPLDTVLTVEEAKTMYRIITGACKAGTQGFVDSVRDIKETYTIAEIIEMTRGHYGAEVFRRFFEEA